MSLIAGLWAGLGAAALGLEVIALLNRTPGDTLSEQVWRWLRHPGPWGRVRRTALLVGLVWLTVHWLGFGRVV